MRCCLDTDGAWRAPVCEVNWCLHWARLVDGSLSRTRRLFTWDPRTPPNWPTELLEESDMCSYRLYKRTTCLSDIEAASRSLVGGLGRDFVRRVYFKSNKF